MTQPRAAVFLDRDGTLIEDADFLTSTDQIRILPGTIPGLKKLHDAGFLLVVVSNQSAVARGLLTRQELDRINQHLIDQIELLGGHLDAVFCCPHHPDGTVTKFARPCTCRKPKPGLFLQARDALGIDLRRSFAVGDAWRDVEAAWTLGIPSVKLPRPPARQEPPRPDLPVLADADDLNRAADLILATTATAARDLLKSRLPTATATAAAPDQAVHPSPSTGEGGPEGRPRVTNAENAPTDLAAPTVARQEPLPFAAAPDQAVHPSPSTGEGGPEGRPRVTNTENEPDTATHDTLDAAPEPDETTTDDMLDADLATEDTLDADATPDDDEAPQLDSSLEQSPLLTRAALADDEDADLATDQEIEDETGEAVEEAIDEETEEDTDEVTEEEADEETEEEIDEETEEEIGEEADEDELETDEELTEATDEESDEVAVHPSPSRGEGGPKGRVRVTHAENSASVLATPQPPSRPVYLCRRCGIEIDPADLENGAAGEFHDALLCPDCLPTVARMAGAHAAGASRAAPDAEAPDADTLDQILIELRRLARRNQDEPFGLPKIMGYVAQLAALGIAGAALFVSQPGQTTVLLLAAVFVQLIALTMFVLSGRDR